MNGVGWGDRADPSVLAGRDCVGGGGEHSLGAVGQLYLAEPSLIAVVGYAGAFWFLSVPLRVMPMGVVYALWSGLRIVLITAVALVWQRQVLDSAALLGLILAGVLVINLFSKTEGH